MKKHKWDIIIPILSIIATLGVAASVKVPLSLHSFNAGELSPLLNSRSDFPKYHAGAKTLQNMLVRAQGPVERRPGTKYIADVKDATDTIRLIPFEYSTTDAYVIELGDLYARFYRNGGQILDVNSDPYEIVTPWDSNDLFELQFAQDSQYMRLVHPDYQPYKLTRTAHTAWTCTAITFEKGPFQPENEDTTITLTPSATTGTINLASTGSDTFDSDHVGALWQLIHTVDGVEVKGTFSGNGNSATTTIRKGQNYDFTTHGTWSGTVTLERTYDGGSTWKTVQPFSSVSDRNINYADYEEEDTATYRITMSSYSSGSCVYKFLVHSYDVKGVVQIATVVDANDATATVTETLGGTSATYRWSEGYWSDYRGWPRSVEHYEQRAVYGGTASYPQTIWASIVADEDTDYDDFDAGDSTDDDAYTFVLPGMNPIQWLRGQEYLMVGTTAGVGRFGMSDVPTTPTQVQYRMQAKTGSDYIQAVHAVNAILYVERGGQKVREVSYTSVNERYVADDMTILAEHITGTGITEIDFQNRPDPILWCVRDDGVLLSFTYLKRHEVQSWARQVTDGTFNSIAVIPGTDEDVVYTVAGRTIDSNSVQYVENFAPVDWGTDQNDMWFVDSGVTDGNSLSHLEGEEVIVLNDARPGTAETVSSGVITASGYSNYVIGLPYTSICETMPVVAHPDVGFMKTAVMNVRLDLQDTLVLNLGADADNTSSLQFSEDSWATTIDTFTGIKTASFPRGVSRERTIYIDANDPLPMKIRGITADLEVMSD